MKTTAAGPMMVSALATVLISTPALSKERPESSAPVIALSQQAKAQADARTAERVQREFDFSLGDVTRILTPAQLRVALGVGDSAGDAASQAQVESIEVQAHRPEQQVQTRIPFGLASIAWAVKNPREAWRVFAPVAAG